MDHLLTTSPLIVMAQSANQQNAHAQYSTGFEGILKQVLKIKKVNCQNNYFSR